MSRKKNTDRGRLSKASKEWRQRFDNKQFGAPPEEYFLGIVAASRQVPKEAQSNCEYEFTLEAEQILERVRSQGRQADICIAESKDAVASFVGNRAITDLVFIGHGHLTKLRLGDDSHLTWFNLFKYLDHLKQGHVNQRVCGGAYDDVSVALGTFAVSDMRNVFAPVNRGFEPTSLDDREANDSIFQVYNYADLSEQELLAFSETMQREAKVLRPPILPRG